MRCISKKRTVFLAGMLGISVLFSGCQKKEENIVATYEKEQYNQSLFKGELYAKDLCVATENVALEGYEEIGSLHGAALFDLKNENTLYAYDMHDRLYPASVTKIMTALLALEKGNMDDKVKISANAAASSFPSDAQLMGLRQGEEWSLGDLVYALMLYSGNDAGTAIAEHIAGSEPAFVEMMNERAAGLMATGTHFTNPHGLHDDEHYTTAYDLYLIFNECIKDERFVTIIETQSYDATFKRSDGTADTLTVTPTNLYAKGTVEKPESAIIIGGKTGTTGEAGYCLILLEEDTQKNPYISIVMGATDKPALYANMTALIEAIPETVSP